MNRLLLFALLGVFATGCSNQEEELRARIAELETQLDDCQNGAEKLLGQIEAAFDNGEHSDVANIYTKIVKKHNGSDEQKKAEIIKNESSKIVAEKRAIEEAEKIKKEKERTASLNKLKKNIDDVSGITWYKQPYFTHYTNSNRVSIYMGQRENTMPWVNILMSYTGDSWIFFERAYLSYEGNTIEIVYDKYDDKESDNGNGGVWEWIELQLDAEQIKFLKAFAKSPDAKMRLSGKYTKTRNLSANERKGISDILAGYEALRGEIEPGYTIAD